MMSTNPYVRGLASFVASSSTRPNYTVNCLHDFLTHIDVSKNPNDPLYTPAGTEILVALLECAVVSDEIIDRIRSTYNVSQLAQGELAKMMSDLEVDVARLEELSYTMSSLIRIGYGEGALYTWQRFSRMYGEGGQV